MLSLSDAAAGSSKLTNASCFGHPGGPGRSCAALYDKRTHCAGVSVGEPGIRRRSELREDCVIEAVTAEADAPLRGQPVYAIENLTPAIFRHKEDQYIETDDSLLLDVPENDFFSDLPQSV